MLRTQTITEKSNLQLQVAQNKKDMKLTAKMLRNCLGSPYRSAFRDCIGFIAILGTVDKYFSGDSRT